MDFQTPLDLGLHATETGSSSEEYHTAILDGLDKMFKDLQTMEDQFLRLGVRTHLLEVELATQFSPDLMEERNKAQQTCQECQHTLEEQRHRVDNHTNNEESHGQNSGCVVAESVASAEEESQSCSMTTEGEDAGSSHTVGEVNDSGVGTVSAGDAYEKEVMEISHGSAVDQ